MPAFGHLVAPALGDVAATMFCNQGSDLGPLFFKFGRISNDVLNDEICCHLLPPAPVDHAFPPTNISTDFSKGPTLSAQQNTMLQSRHVDIVDAKIRPVECLFNCL